MSRRSSKTLKWAFDIRPLCAYCGVILSYAEYGSNYATTDHIVPISRGGSEAKENKTLACLDCNRKKANGTSWVPSFTFADLKKVPPTLGTIGI